MSSLAAASTDSSSRSEICFSSSVARDRIGLLRQLGLELFVQAQQVEPVGVELGGLLEVQRAELVALLVIRQDGETRLRGSQRHLLALVGQARGEDGVLELVVLLGQLGGDQPAFAGLPQPVEPLAVVAVGGLLLLTERPELVAAEEVGVAGDDRGLLRHFLLADPDRAALLRTVEQVALKLLLELGWAADGSRRHREDSIRVAIPPAAPSCAPCP